MRTRTRFISTAGILVLAAITGACADANPTGISVPERPAHSVSTAAATAWTASGPGTVTVVSDGTAGDAVMSYSFYSDDGNTFWEWQFTTTAAQTGTVTLPWTFSGNHGDNATTTVFAMVNGEPIELLSEGTTQGEFTVSGTYTFTVNAGDTYGFDFGGLNPEVGALLSGTFTVDLPEAPVGPATKEDCKNGGWMSFGFKNQGTCIEFVQM